jgi:hypothetical protein
MKFKVHSRAFLTIGKARRLNLTSSLRLAEYARVFKALQDAAGGSRGSLQSGKAFSQGKPSVSGSLQSGKAFSQRKPSMKRCKGNDMRGSWE